MTAERDAALIHALRSERIRWSAIRAWAAAERDVELLARMDQASREYAERNKVVAEPDGWLWRPKESDGRLMFRRGLEGRGYWREVEVVPVMFADEWRMVSDVRPDLATPLQ